MTKHNKPFFAMLKIEKIRAKNLGLALNSLAERVSLDDLYEAYNRYDKIADAQEIAETPAMEYLTKQGAGILR